MAYRQIPYRGPWAGIQANIPPPLVDPLAFDDIVNWFCRRGRIQSRPPLQSFGSPPDGAILRNALSFIDATNSLHTLALTTKNAYFLTAGPTYNLATYPGGLVDLSGTGLPYATAYINQKVFFNNGSTTLLYADGESSVKDANAAAACKYLGVLQSALLMVNTIEPAPGTVGATNFPQRIRWSAVGNPTDWTSFTSGFADNLEVADGYTGFTVLGSYGYAFRTEGITIVTPTGSGSAPFQISQYSYSPSGVGNRYPYSLATYGNLCVFVANDDVYSMSIAAAPQRIGTKAKPKIFADLNLASGDEVVGSFVSDLTGGFDFLSYWLSIPGVNVTWVYHFDEGSWTRFSSTLGRLTCMANVATS